MTHRPETNEYNPYYLAYINMVPNGNIIDLLDKQKEKISGSLQDLTDQQAGFRYGPDKWSIKEVIGHMADTERIMAYRLLCIARGETTSLPGFDEKQYVHNAAFDNQSLQELLGNFISVRESTLHLLKGLTEDDWLKQGLANHSEVTVRAIAYIIAGHERHHLNIIQERYIQSNAFPRS